MTGVQTCALPIFVTTIPVSFAQAALGAKLALATLDGDEEVVIAPGTPAGREFVYRQRGGSKMTLPRHFRLGPSSSRHSLLMMIPMSRLSSLSDSKCPVSPMC